MSGNYLPDGADSQHSMRVQSVDLQPLEGGGVDAGPPHLIPESVVASCKAQRLAGGLKSHPERSTTWRAQIAWSLFKGLPANRHELHHCSCEAKESEKGNIRSGPQIAASNCQRNTKNVFFAPSWY